MLKIMFLACLITASTGLANINEEFLMLPLRFEETMKVGETREFTLQIRNDMKKKKMEDYILKISEFNLNDQGGIVVKSKRVNERTLVPYVRLSNDKVNIDPSSSISVKVIVSIPKDYKKGSGYFIFTLTKDVELLKAKRKIKNGAIFMKTLTGFFAVNVKENQKFDVDIASAKYEKNILTVDLKNQGESFLKTSAKAVILDSSNKKIGVFELIDSKNRAEFLNIPDSIRKVSAAIPSSVLKNRKDLKVNITISDTNNNYINNKTLNLQLGK